MVLIQACALSLASTFSGSHRQETIQLSPATVVAGLNFSLFSFLFSILYSLFSFLYYLFPYIFS